MTQSKANDKGRQTNQRNKTTQSSEQTLHGGSGGDKLTLADCIIQNTKLCARKMFSCRTNQYNSCSCLRSYVRHTRHSLTGTSRHHRYQRALLRGAGIAHRRSRTCLDRSCFALTAANR